MQEENYRLIKSFEKENWWYRAKRDLFAKILGSSNRKFLNALDVGCGVGSNLTVLKRFSSKVTGIDSIQNSINHCLRAGYTSIYKMKAAKMRFASNSFDLVLCSDVLEHLDDKKAIAEITRVLKKGGLLIFSVPAHNYLWGPTDIISQHVKRYEKKDFFILLGNNYRIHKLSYWNFFMFFPNLIFIKLIKLTKNYNKPKNTLSFIPRFLNSVIYYALSLENRIFTKINIPQGVSIVGVAKKCR